MKYSKICIGCASFGKEYGITNKNSIKEIEDAESIFQVLKEEQIWNLDTAVAYGKSESIIGYYQNKFDQRFHVSSKISCMPWIKDANNAGKYLEKEIRQMLRRVKSSSLDTLYIHDIELLNECELQRVIEGLKIIRDKRLIKNIGASIYELETLSRCDSSEIQVLQLPFSVFNQSFGKFIESNTSFKIRLRSIFLQGILLNPPAIVKGLGIFGSEFIHHHQAYCELLNDENIDNTTAAIATALMHNSDQLVIGISSYTEVTELITSFKNAQNLSPEIVKKIADFKWHNPLEYDPRYWQKSNETSK